MSRPTLVLVDPNPGRLATFERALGKHFELYACASPDLAVSMVSSMKAQLLVATMEQALGDGLDLCANAVRACTEHRPVTVVFGTPTEEAVASVRVGKLADIVIGQDLTTQQLLRVLARRLKGGLPTERYEPPALDIDEQTGVSYYSARPEPELKPARGLPGLGMVARARATMADNAARTAAAAPLPELPTTWTGVHRALTSPMTPLVEELPTDRRPTWSEIANCRPSARNLRIALAKPVTPLIEEIPAEGPLTVSQVLRARASGRNLGLALSPQTWRRMR